MRCTAKSKQSGEQCKRHAVPGKSVCAIHGGKSPGGLASPHLKTGRYSKYLPTRMMERYEEAVKDPTLLELGHEIALVDARLADLLKRVDNGEPGAAWKALKKSYRELRTAMQKQDSGKTIEALADLDMLINQGYGDYAAWQEIQSVIQQRRALVESERKRQIELEQVMSAEQAMFIVGRLVHILKERVTDRNVLAAIQADISRDVLARPG